jgi:hypothetical protein
VGKIGNVEEVVHGQAVIEEGAAATLRLLHGQT